MRTSLLLVCTLVSAGLLSGPADARPRDRQEQRQDHRQASAQERQEQQRQGNREERQEPRPNDRGDRSADAARRAQQRNGGGRVLSVDPEGGGYRVKVLKDGEVRTHHVDVED